MPADRRLPAKWLPSIVARGPSKIGRRCSQHWSLGLVLKVFISYCQTADMMALLCCEQSSSCLARVATKFSSNDGRT